MKCYDSIRKNWCEYNLFVIPYERGNPEVVLKTWIPDQVGNDSKSFDDLCFILGVIAIYSV